MASLFPPTQNPTLDARLREEVTFFMKWGYLVIEEAITVPQLESLRGAMDAALERKESEAAAAAAATGKAEGKVPNTAGGAPDLSNRLFGELLEEDERFEFLLDNEPVIRRMKAVLGNAVQLHSATARCTRTGAVDQDWHRDVPWAMDPDGTPYGAGPGQINCGYFLDTITMENGPIALVSDAAPRLKHCESLAPASPCAAVRRRPRLSASSASSLGPSPPRPLGPSAKKSALSPPSATPATAAAAVGLPRGITLP